MISVLLSLVLHSNSFAKDFRLMSCAKVETQKACDMSLETAGYGARKYTLYERDVLGELSMLKSGNLDVTGKSAFRVKWDEIGEKSVVVVLFDSVGPVAMDGADILVVPDKYQLGEQTDMLFLDSTPEQTPPF